jgi:hypothetical protein
MTPARPGTRRRLSALAVAFLLLPWHAALAADQASAAAVKAAFVLNFAKFIRWPDDALAASQPVNLCVIGDAAVADALATLVRGQQIEGHELAARLLKRDDALRECHVLFVSARDGEQAIGMVASVRNAPVFTVADCEKFTDAGGIAQLMNENGRMRFAINLSAATKARLSLSSKLLGLAKTVK